MSKERAHSLMILSIIIFILLFGVFSMNSISSTNRIRIEHENECRELGGYIDIRQEWYGIFNWQYTRTVECWDRDKKNMYYSKEF